MTTLLWDQIDTRFYESGVDRGVLYLSDGKGIPWNGLISVVEKSSGGEGTPVYFDGIKYSDILPIPDYSMSLKAYTYPDEFLEFEGVIGGGNGLFVTNQPTKRFALSYRTMIKDAESNDVGYKIHILYNLLATPSQKTYQTMSTDANPIEFEWNVTSIPDKVSGFRPSAHLILDTRKMSPLLVADIESTLYGSIANDPQLPGIATITSFIDSWVIIRITDNYDGTWTATGPASLISMLNFETFQIIQADVKYLDPNTYEITDTTY